MANELSQLSAYYDRKSARDMDYRGYMEKQAMVKDIGTAVQRGADQQMIMTSLVGSNITNRLDNVQDSIVQMHTGIQTSIKAQTLTIVASQMALAHTFNQGFDRLNNTLDMGFAGITSQLGEMTSAFNMGFAKVETAIHKMSDEICKRLDAIHDIVNNPLLTQSRELYRRSVVNNNKGFYEEALEDIKQAVEKNKTDYISWFLMGKIYAFGAGKFSNVIDLEKAINAYSQAAKYNSPDINESTDARLLAAEIYFYLGIAQYSQCNEFLRAKKKDEAIEILSKALQSFEESFNYSNKMLEALFNIARCKVLFGKKEEALNDLEKLVLQERNYCIKVYDDGDFSVIEEQFTELINKLRKKAFIIAKERYDHINNLLSELTSLGESANEKIPSTFTDDLPYFDILDYSDEFRRIIPVLKEAIKNRKDVLAFEAEYNEVKQKIQKIIDSIKKDEYPKDKYSMEYLSLEENSEGLELLLSTLNGNLSKWWNTVWTKDNLPEKYDTYQSSSKDHVAKQYNETRGKLQALISNNYIMWELLLKRDLSLLNTLKIMFEEYSEHLLHESVEIIKREERVPNLLIGLSIIIDIAGIVLAFINWNFIIAILGLVFGGIIISIASKKHPDGQGDGIEGWNLVSILGGVHLFIISFIAGFGFHSFLLGLVGVIISIAPAIIIGIIEESR